MGIFMTTNTKSIKIEDMCFIISSWMMPYSCLFVAIVTFAVSNMRNFSYSLCIFDYPLRPNHCWVISFLFFVLFFCIQFALRCTKISFNYFITNHTSIFCLFIMVMFSICASLATGSVSRGAIIATIKLKKRFCDIASRATFCYDWFRHSFLLTRKLCLEPIAGTHQRLACLIVSINPYHSIENKIILRSNSHRRCKNVDISRDKS